MWNNITEADSNRIGKYCDELRRQGIANEPSSYFLGRIEKADPVPDDPNSKFYYWFRDLRADAGDGWYFDSRSNIGKKIMKVCNIGSTCVLKIVVRKSWELNVDHATFWIAKVTEVKRMRAQ